MNRWQHSNSRVFASTVTMFHCPPTRVWVRRSGLNDAIQWKCVFMLSWCCASVVTGLVVWNSCHSSTVLDMCTVLYLLSSSFTCWHNLFLLHSLSQTWVPWGGLRPRWLLREGCERSIWANMTWRGLRWPQVRPSLRRERRSEPIIIITIIITAASGAETRSTNHWIEPSARSSHRPQVGLIFLSFGQYNHLNLFDSKAPSV